jgi:VCBS repeat-containing protein
MYKEVEFLHHKQTSLDTGIAIVDFADLSFTGVTLTAQGALIYNTSESNKAVAVLNFGGNKTATAGTFTIQFPDFNSTSAILRIS